MGVGSKVTRCILHAPETYWIITRVKLSPKNQDYGKAWGRFVWRGMARPTNKRIGTALKKQWSLVEAPDYTKFDGTEAKVEAMIPTVTEYTC